MNKGKLILLDPTITFIQSIEIYLKYGYNNERIYTMLTCLILKNIMLSCLMKML